jgi:hypothetical protein
LDWLAQDFAAHKYDVRRELRGIVLSQVYALGATTGPPEAFAGALERPLSAEQLARSWRVATGLPPEDEALRRAAISALPDVLPRDYNATYQQAQFLANSSLLGGMLKPAPGSAVKRLESLTNPADRVRAAFLEVFERPPDREEEAQAESMLKARSKQPDEAVRDLLWAMMTSAEFLTTP